MPLILLTAFFTPIVVIAGWQVIEKRVAQYMAAFLILSGLMNGVFSALDGLLFYVFFEFTLLPLFFLVGAAVLVVAVAPAQRVEERRRGDARDHDRVHGGVVGEGPYDQEASADAFALIDEIREPVRLSAGATLTVGGTGRVFKGKSLREAIQKLVSKGLLHSRQGGGTYVTDALESTFFDPWQDMMGSYPNLREDMLEFRRMLEGQAAEWAVKEPSSDPAALRQFVAGGEQRDAKAAAWTTKSSPPCASVIFA